MICVPSLYGPPGTGKTSLCRALAQKLSIRVRDRYPHSVLVEINAHSLFSKWFSESGKLVMKLFRKIRELIEDPESLVCVLIGILSTSFYTRKCRELIHFLILDRRGRESNSSSSSRNGQLRAIGFYSGCKCYPYPD